MLDPNQNIRTQATIQAVEAQRNEALTKNVHLIAQMAVLQTLLKTASEEISKLKAVMAAKEKEQPPAPPATNNGKAERPLGSPPAGEAHAQP